MVSGIENEKHFFSGFLAQIDETVAVIDLQGKIYYINKNTESTLGELSIQDIADAPTAQNILEGAKDSISGKITTPFQGVLFDAPMIVRIVPSAEVGTKRVLLVASRLRNPFQGSIEKSFNKFSSMVRTLPGVVYRIDATVPPNGKPLFLSESVVNLVGYTAEEILTGKIKWIDRILEEDRARVNEATDIAKATGETVSFEYRIRHKDNSILWILNQIINVFDDNGKLLYRDGNMLDVTQEKKKGLELEEREKELRTIVSSLDDLVLDLDGDGRIKNFWTQNLSEKLYDLIPYKGKSIMEIQEGHPLFPKPLLDAFASSMANKEKSEIEFQLNPEEGRWFKAKISPIPLNPSHLSASVLISEVTEHKNQEEQIRLLSRVVSSTENIVLITDKKGNIEWANDSFEKITGYTLEEVKGRKPGDILQGEETSPVTVNYIRRQIEAKKPFSCILVNYTKSHEKFWIQIQAQPLHDAEGNFLRYFAIMREVTDERNMMSHLMEQRKKAEESDRLKTAFLTNISHEIRTPMNAIMGFSELLQKDTLSPEKRKSFSSLIYQRSGDLLHILNDILDFSKLEAKQLDVVETEGNLHELMKGLRHGFQVETKEVRKKNINFVYKNEISPEENHIMADFGRVKQVLVNLMGNAVKFTEEGYIELGCKRQTDGTVLFWVSDTGIGIEADKLDIIFKPFRQADNTILRSYGGTGLGLSICLGIVKLWNGKIWVESEPKKGSTFYFTLPYKPFQAGKAL